MITQENTKSKSYKLKDLKVYASTEWLANNEKKYRQVFDRNTTSYVYTELSFFNKLFDEENWEIDVRLICFEIGKTKRKICDLNFKKKISKYDSVVYVREGWGNKKEGAFWKKETYCWEAWLNNEKVGTKYFYIENIMTPLDVIKIQKIRLFEGEHDSQDASKPSFKTYSAEFTRYVHSGIQLALLHKGRNTHIELFIKFFNEARELKGQVIKLLKIKPDDEVIEVFAGWGSNTAGSWRKGQYTMEIVCMDEIMAIVPFDIDEDFEEGEVEAQVFHSDGVDFLLQEETDTLTFEDVMIKLDAMVGLNSIKQKVREHAMYIKFLKLRQVKGLEEGKFEDVHSVFLGNPGTGKTSVAKMLGLLYKKMGLLSKGHVVEVDRVDLVGEYIGQTAPKVKDVIKKARGGVLFIDEAYSLARSNDDSKDFGREVIEIIVKEMSNGEGNLSIIVAGYPKEMNNFLDSNPGLKSRFRHIFEFADYLPQELSQIAEYAAVQKNVKFTIGAKKKIDQYITEEFRNRNRTFGNARYVHNLIETAKINLGLRIMSTDDPEATKVGALQLIKAEDVKSLDKRVKLDTPKIPIDKSLLVEAKKELKSLIGLDAIKKQINELITIIEYHQTSGKSVLNNYYLHTVFIGNPGTGKTTVARILVKIYKALGLLERGHIIETDRQGLIAGYVGQTALKTSEKIDEAMGGVLFIDEAYALSGRGDNRGDFGDEAIETILKRMEDDRGKFFVFAAGYPSNMETFLKANPGLNSRFDKILKFEDYNVIQLVQIAVQMITNNDYKINSKAKKQLRLHLEDLHLKRDKYFGNARDVRKLVLEMIRIQNLRVANAKDETIDDSEITAEDILNIHHQSDNDIFKGGKIGFGNRS